MSAERDKDSGSLCNVYLDVYRCVSHNMPCKLIHHNWKVPFCAEPSLRRNCISANHSPGTEKQTGTGKRVGLSAEIQLCIQQDEDKCFTLATCQSKVDEFMSTWAGDHRWVFSLKPTL